MLQWSPLPPLPPASGQSQQWGVAGLFAGVHNGVLIVAGGANFPKGPPWEQLPDGSRPPKVWWNDIFVLPPQSYGRYQWLTHPSYKLSRPLAYGASISTSDGLVCLGGNDAEQCYPGVFLLKWMATERRIATEQLPSLPRPLSFMAAAKAGDVIYVAGGQAEMKGPRATKTFWALDWPKRRSPDLLVWRELPPWPGPGRVEPIAVAQNNGTADCFYLFSGRYEALGEDSVPLTDAYCFNPAQSAWKRLPDLPGKPTAQGRGGCVMAGAGVAFGSAQILIFGGAEAPLFLRLEHLANQVAALMKQAAGQPQPSGKARMLAQAVAVELERSNTFKSHPGFSRDILIYDTINNRWELRPNELPFPGPVDTVAVRWDKSIVLPSGEVRPGIRTPHVWKAESATPVSGFANRAHQGAVSPELRNRAVGVLRQALAKETLRVKVRAAEILVSLDYPQQVRETLMAELNRAGTDPESRLYLEGVLALAASTQAERERWVHRLRQVFLQAGGPEQPLAAQALGRLRYRVGATPAERAAFAQAAQSRQPALSIGARWVLANSGLEEDQQLLAQWLDSNDASARAQSAYALRSLPGVSLSTWQKIAHSLAANPPDPVARPFLLSAAWVHAPSKMAAEPLQPELLRYAQTGNREQRAEACAALAACGHNEQLPLLAGLLNDPEAAVRVAAAGAILRIDRRAPHRMARLDWAVIAAYGLMMLTIGWYYSRRTATTDDYLLGGRTMRSWTVGLSLFATLLSTLSYVAYPGEMAKYGPMILAGFLSYPLVFLVVGWLLIPYIMQLRVTSAYEILEARLGLSVRLLGSFFFLSLRLLWMATIVYVTAGTVMIPVLSLSPQWAPWIAVALGMTTLIYATMGGLRAVVLTDVIQTFILFLGAILTLVLILWFDNGIGDWIPRRWPASWEPPKFWFDSQARVTLAGALLLNFLWYVCTAGSDQIAIQRYLATRNVRAARRAMGTSLAADFLVTLLLSALGLALFAFFSAHPHLMPDGQTIQANADNLFPRFMTVGLPVGLTGLVVAGVLAAAMSSLSAGINSSCSVVTVDLINRFRRQKNTPAQSVRRAKITSAAIGLGVILLSLVGGYVKGNVLELMYKVVNLFVAPLFLLFFMALFVRWATALGTIVGALGSVAAAVSISFFEIFGLKFIWIMPVSLLTGIVVGMLASLVPIGSRFRRSTVSHPQPW